tara:strand:- start:1607 stop:2857 length:1251 start_codon:yes stop_codon:yes gene_type:complete
MLKKNINNSFIFFVGFLTKINVTIVGQVAISELIVLVDLLNIKSWINVYKKIPTLRKVLLYLFIYLVSQILSDIVNHTELRDSLRGCSNIIITGILFFFYVKYFNKSYTLIVPFIIGQSASLILEFYLSSVSFLSQDFTKFTLIPFLSYFVLLYCWFLLKKGANSIIIVYFILISFGLISFYFDSRANGMFFLLTFIIFYKRDNIVKFKLRKVIPYSIAIILIFQLLYSLYIYQSLQGYFVSDRSLYQLERIENPYNPIELLKTGRSETFVAISAIADKPYFGHGSWAKDKTGKYTTELLELHDDSGKLNNPEFMDNFSEIIPSHSIIFGAWMNAGVLAFLSIFMIMIIFIKSGFKALKYSINYTHILPLLIYLTILGIWAILFSPLPYLRVGLMFSLAFSIVTLNLNYQNNIKIK